MLSDVFCGTVLKRQILDGSSWIEVMEWLQPDFAANSTFPADLPEADPDLPSSSTQSDARVMPLLKRSASENSVSGLLCSMYTLEDLNAICKVDQQRKMQ